MDINIMTTGMVTPAGNDENTIWTNIIGNKTATQLNKKISFTSVVSPGKARKMSRFSQLGLCAAVSSVNNIGDAFAQMDRNRVGAIFTTGYGPLETNLEFAKQMIQDEPDFCSPTVFMNTVHNACLGNIAMELKITGPSTMLLGSNHFMLSKLILEENKADLILAGSIEEYNEELKESLEENGLKSSDIGEASIVFGLARASKDRSDNIKLTEVVSFGLGFNPYEHITEDKVKESRLGDYLKVFFENNQVDAVIINDRTSALGQFEYEFLSDRAAKCIIIDKCNDFFGNVLGCDLGLKLLVAKLCLENNTIPPSLNTKQLQYSCFGKVAVLSTEITGNYSIAVLEK
ncbi:beta-ketoacyl synthase N-terminal-like domain-containing protein [Paenibacillus azoreducens]|uniref:Beta-ketoacyl synthase-like N-terminal domain-containing protein n=1 Tax=Paenibacillus azoreducens TaxID=116718 RepID=A0A920CPZ1_9BACL|nr:beta-ketoacyl synthase N-terminal-like domain-containing protein [Paenibacillus azoreducens]GIO49211.1 hypothetical protein J34TS1_39760 [Paenibacillus azoreducens]